MLFSIFGSDARQSWLASLLMQDGYTVVHTHSEIVPADAVILPIPTLNAAQEITGSSLPFPALLAQLPRGSMVWGNCIAAFRSEAERHQIKLFDFAEYEAFAEGNAIPTAEGALQLVMQELPGTIFGGKFLVIGYGRIGKALTARLLALGADVTVARRSACEPLPCRCDRSGVYRYPLCEYDAIFNTAPHAVFSENDCQKTKQDCLLIDLASAPGGICRTTARRLIHATGLPAKTAPKAAAEIMKTIILTETEVEP